MYQPNENPLKKETGISWNSYMESGEILREELFSF